jgi:hypothetical protein
MLDLSLCLKACDDDVERIGNEFRDDGPQCAGCRMTESWKRCSDCAMAMCLLGDVVEGEGVLSVQCQYAPCP